MDSKNRVTLRSAQCEYYNVKELESCCYILEPRELTMPRGISARTLRDGDEAGANLHANKVSDAIDLSDF